MRDAGGRWCGYGMYPFPSAVEHPTDEPWVNQKHDWPEEQRSVPFEHAHVYGSISPVSGCLPSAHGIPGEASIELRDGGIIIEPCPRAPATIAANTITTRIVLAGKVGGYMCCNRHSPRQDPGNAEPAS